jgi:hypothetical protein
MDIKNLKVVLNLTPKIMITKSNEEAIDHFNEVILNELYTELWKHGLKRGDVWVAGGAIRDFLIGKNYKDIDLFFNSKEAFELVFEYFNKRPAYSALYNTNNSLCFDGCGVRVDLVKHIEKDMRDCIDRFDFLFCRFATDGVELVEDIKNMSRLFLQSQPMVVNVVGFNTPISTMKRVIRYAKRGYSISPQNYIELIHHIQKAPSVYSENGALRYDFSYIAEDDYLDSFFED